MSQSAPLKACSSPNPAPISDARTARTLHTVSWDTPVSRMAFLGPRPWPSLLIPVPTVLLLLLFLLPLVSAHPQGLSGLQGEPSLGESSSGEDDLGVEDLPSEEDAPGEAPPEVNAEAEKEDSPKLEDLPTVEAPEDSHGSHGDGKGKWSSASKLRLR